MLSLVKSILGKYIPKVSSLWSR